MVKSHFHQQLYTIHPILTRRWDDINVEFIVALLITHREKDAIMVVVERFSKMACFVACHKSDDRTHITDLFFQEIVRFHGIQ